MSILCIASMFLISAVTLVSGVSALAVSDNDTKLIEKKARLEEGNSAAVTTARPVTPASEEEAATFPTFILKGIVAPFEPEVDEEVDWPYFEEVRVWGDPGFHDFQSPRNFPVRLTQEGPYKLSEDFVGGWYEAYELSPRSDRRVLAEKVKLFGAYDVNARIEGERLKITWKMHGKIEGPFVVGIAKPDRPGEVKIDRRVTADFDLPARIAIGEPFDFAVEASGRCEARKQDLHPMARIVFYSVTAFDGEDWRKILEKIFLGFNARWGEDWTHRGLVYNFLPKFPQEFGRWKDWRAQRKRTKGPLPVDLSLRFRVEPKTYTWRMRDDKPPSLFQERPVRVYDVKVEGMWQETWSTEALVKAGHVSEEITEWRLAYRRQRAPKHVSVDRVGEALRNLAACDRVVVLLDAWPAEGTFRHREEGRQLSAGSYFAPGGMLHHIGPLFVVYEREFGDYPTWFAEMRQRQADLLQLIAATWFSNLQLAGAAHADRAEAYAQMHYYNSLKLSDDSETAAKVSQLGDVLMQVRKLNRRLLAIRKCQRQMIAAVEAGWRNLEIRIEERLKNGDDEDDIKDELEQWLQRVSSDSSASLTQLRALISEGRDGKEKVLDRLRQLTQQVVSSADKQRLWAARLALGDYAHLLQELSLAHSDNPGDEDVRELYQQLELYFLNEIARKLRFEHQAVDSALAAWGGGWIDLQTGDWKLPDEWQFTWWRWFGILTDETNRLWETARSKHAEFTEYLLGLQLMMHLRRENPSLSLEDIALMSPEELPQHLPAKMLPPSSPTREGRATILAKALISAATKNPDVERLIQGKPPLLKQEETYVKLGEFRDQWANLDAWTGELIFNGVVVPLGIGAIGQVVFRTATFAAAVEIINKYRWGKAFLKPAVAMAKYENYIASLPGASGLSVRGADFIVRPYLMGMASMKASELAEKLGAGEYASNAVFCLTLLYQGAGHTHLTQRQTLLARAASLRSQEILEKGQREMALLAKSRYEKIKVGATENKKHHSKLKELTEDAISLEPGGNQKTLRMAAKKQAVLLDKEINQMADRLFYRRSLQTGKVEEIPYGRLVGNNAVFDEKLRLRDAFRRLAERGVAKGTRPPTTSRRPSSKPSTLKSRAEEVKREMEALEKLAKARQEEFALVEKQFLKLKPLLPKSSASSGASRADRNSARRRRQQERRAEGDKALQEHQKDARAFNPRRPTPSQRGMLLKHHQNLMKLSEGEKLIIMVRDSKEAALPFTRNRRNYRPKGVDVKEKTSKIDPHLGVVTCRSQDFTTQEAYEQAVRSFKKRDYQLVDGIVVDKKGRAIYSDYDLHGVYRNDGSPLLLDVNSNSRAFLDKINTAIDAALTGLQRKVQHGAHDDWRFLKLMQQDAEYLRFLKTKGVEPESFKKLLAQQTQNPGFRLEHTKTYLANYQPAPPVTVYHNGNVSHLRTVAEMKKFYQKSNIFWPYQN